MKFCKNQKCIIYLFLVKGNRKKCPECGQHLENTKLNISKEVFLKYSFGIFPHEDVEKFKLLKKEILQIGIWDKNYIYFYPNELFKRFFKKIYKNYF